MIRVNYLYHRQSDNTWQEDSKIFEYPNMALRFIYKMKRSLNHVYTGYICDYPEEHEYISMRLKF